MIFIGQKRREKYMYSTECLNGGVNPKEKREYSLCAMEFKRDNSPLFYAPKRCPCGSESRQFKEK